MPPLFRLIQDKGGVFEAEMFRVFNMGTGFILVVAPDAAEETLARLRARRPGGWVRPWQARA